MSVALQNQKITPLQGESYSAFIFRAHNSLRGSIPNSNRRNEIAWNAWESVYGDNLRDKALDRFPSDRYQHAPNVCYFQEHSIDRPDGSKIVYDFNELARMVETMNDRCDSEAYSAIASHHTDNRLKGPAVEPKVIGYAGPYRLGMTGDRNPKWAIFGDEHQNTQYSQIFDERRRRSVEVLRPLNGEPSYIDPIATLGADSPRLPLPVARYEASSTDAERFTYSMPSNFAAVGQGNTFIESDRINEQYEESEPSNMPGISSLTEQDIHSIIDGLLATPQMQWVTEQMHANPSGNPLQSSSHQQAPQSPSNPLPMPPQHPSPAPTQPTVPRSPSQYQSLPNSPCVTNGVGLGGGPQPYQRYSATDGQENEVTPERYAQLEANNAELIEQYSQVVAQHEQLIAANQHNVEQLAQMNCEVAKLKQANADASRAMRLKDLCTRYSHMLSFDEEAAACLYQNGSSMDEDTFNAHCEKIERYAQRAPLVTPMAPDGILGSRRLDPKSEEEINREVVHRYSMESSNGTHRPYEVILAEVKAERGITAA